MNLLPNAFISCVANDLCSDVPFVHTQAGDAKDTFNK